MTTTNSESNVALPWEKSFTLPTGQALEMMSIVAQGNGYGVVLANGNIGTTH